MRQTGLRPASCRNAARRRRPARVPSAGKPWSCATCPPASSRITSFSPRMAGQRRFQAPARRGTPPPRSGMPMGSIRSASTMARWPPTARARPSPSWTPTTTQHRQRPAPVRPGVRPPRPALHQGERDGGSTLPAANASWARKSPWTSSGPTPLLRRQHPARRGQQRQLHRPAGRGRLCRQAAGRGGRLHELGRQRVRRRNSYDGSFQTPAGHAGVTFVASSGDSGAPPAYPAASPNVLAVGGTTLNLDASGNILSESGWSGSGGGISTSKPSRLPEWRGDPEHTARANPDVAYDADPNTGFPVYDSYTNGTRPRGSNRRHQRRGAAVGRPDRHRRPGPGPGRPGSLDGRSQTLPDCTPCPRRLPRHHHRQQQRVFGQPGYDLVTGRGTPVANLIVPALAGQSTSRGRHPFQRVGPGRQHRRRRLHRHGDRP